MHELPIQKKHIVQQRELPSEYASYKREDLPTVQEIWEQIQAVNGEVNRAREHKNFQEIPADQLHQCIEDCLNEIDAIERAARNKEKWKISAEMAQRRHLIVNLAAPGTYYLSSKNDKYRDKPWATLLDRERADTSAILGIQIAAQTTGQNHSLFTKSRILDGLDPDLNRLRPDVHESIEASGTHFLYIGTEQEGDAIRKVLASPTSFIPEDVVTIIDQSIGNTLDSIHALKQFLQSSYPPGETTHGKPLSIDFVMGAQALRTLRMCNKFDVIPSEALVNLFPMATPQSGIREYPKNEISGTIYYALTNDASLKPVPYSLMGEDNIL
ncbi:MAG: hypothetical protein Q7S04_03630 [Candidatus Moranbacteria bacterium]|nr:hypothetical protein [Candidatus Moranbacteria bacterium]